MIDIGHYVSLLKEDTFVIYLFHGVVEKSDYEVRNYTRKHLKKDEFCALIKSLKSRGYVLTMDEIVDNHRRNKKCPKYSYAITFDDGFENNFSVAAPILFDLNIPAIFYVSTELIQKNSMTWTDKVEYCIEQIDSGSLHIDWLTKPVVFNSKSSKIEFIEMLRNTVKANADIDTEELVVNIYNQCDLDPIIQSEDPLDKKMSWKQVQTLHEETRFTVGGHSHRHVNMAFLGEDELNYEVSKSIYLMKEKAGINTCHYAYPEGLEHCFSDKVIETLRKYGVVCCPTAIEGVNNNITDLFYLRRFFVV
jgi:peptidoglycan/xylan/chitin deacetylase (PgdA/CDA1 family)